MTHLIHKEDCMKSKGCLDCSAKGRECPYFLDVSCTCNEKPKECTCCCHEENPPGVSCKCIKNCEHCNPPVEKQEKGCDMIYSHARAKHRGEKCPYCTPDSPLIEGWRERFEKEFPRGGYIVVIPQYSDATLKRIKVFIGQEISRAKEDCEERLVLFRKQEIEDLDRVREEAIQEERLRLKGLIEGMKIHQGKDCGVVDCDRYNEALDSVLSLLTKE